MAGEGIQIHEFRISFIATEVVLGVATHEIAPTSIPRPEVADRSRYIAYFNSPSGPLQRPWPGRRQGFWEEYLERAALPDVGGGRAYRELLPLRAGNVIALEAGAGDRATAYVEGLLYPWGSAAIVSVRYRHTWNDLDDPVEAVHQIRGEPWFSGGGQAAGMLRLDGVLAAAREKLRIETFGDVEATSLATEPFSIHTTIHAGGARESFALDREGVRRFLHGVTSFSAAWKTDQLPDLSEVTVAGRRDRPADHVVYGRRRARALWAPNSALTPSSHALGCQHRNLVLASAHHESLAGFLAATARWRRESSGPFHATHRMLAKRASIALGFAFHGTNTYKSGSLRHQVEANGWLPDINFIRKEFQLDAVAPA